MHVHSDELGIIFSVAPPAPAPAEPTSAKREGPPPSHPSTTAAAAAPAAGAAGAEPQFILQEHKLGVSVHSIHPLVNEARAALPAARREYRRLKQQACVESFRGRVDQDQNQDQDEDGTKENKAVTAAAAAAAAAAVAAAAAAAERLLSVTRALLLVNADHGSAWNARKEIAADGLCDGGSIPQEIKASGLLLCCAAVVSYDSLADVILLMYKRQHDRPVTLCVRYQSAVVNT